MTRTAIFTIVSNNYLAYARVLMRSVRSQHPDSDRFCVVVDRDYRHADGLSEEFALIRLEQLALAQLARHLFQYSVLEANTSVKPMAFTYLFDQGYDQVIYLDPDIALFSPMNEVLDALAAQATAVLTPHLLAPHDDGKHPSDLDILRAGTYNLGFLALRNAPDARRLLAWWHGKVEHQCVIDQDAGIFVDQRWIDLVPGLFPGIHILRHAGYNVAYWNIPHRVVACDRGSYVVGAFPLVFFHFSGLDPHQPQRFSRYQDRVQLADLGAAIPLVDDYVAQLFDAGMERFGQLEYGYGRFDDGTVIADALRSAYRKDSRLRWIMGDNPFEHPESLSALRPRASPAGGYSGIYGDDPADCVDGLWIGDRATIPLPPQSGPTVRLCGVHFPEWHQSMHGSGTIQLSALLGNHALGVHEIQAPGEFEVAFEIPPSVAQEQRLSIELRCSGYFVPAAIGHNDDPRRLALKLQKVVVGTAAIVDYLRTPPLLEWPWSAPESGVALPPRIPAAVHPLHAAPPELPGAPAATTGVFVVGMHRSGTSLLVRVLESLGCVAGTDADFYPPTAHDPAGHREHRLVWRANEMALAAVGRAWDDPVGIEWGLLAETERNEISAAIRRAVVSLETHRPWVAKDPRLCLTLPLWRSATRPVCVMTHRNPMEVARSLAARDAMTVFGGLALWEWYQRAALIGSKGLTRVFVAFSDLVADPDRFPAFLSGRLQAAAPELAPGGAAGPARLDLSLIRQKSQDHEVASWLNPGQRRLFDALELAVAGAAGADDAIAAAAAEAVSPQALEILATHAHRCRLAGQT